MKANSYSKPAHTVELARCKQSPTGVHHWIGLEHQSPIFMCKYCEGFRAFSVRWYHINRFSAPNFMKVFSLAELPTLMRYVKRVNAEPDDLEHESPKNSPKKYITHTSLRHHKTKNSYAHTKTNAGEEPLRITI
jgi:hypothetical protein